MLPFSRSTQAAYSAADDVSELYSSYLVGKIHSTSRPLSLSLGSFISQIAPSARRSCFYCYHSSIHTVPTLIGNERASVPCASGQHVFRRTTLLNLWLLLCAPFAASTQCLPTSSALLWQRALFPGSFNWPQLSL